MSLENLTHACQWLRDGGYIRHAKPYHGLFTQVTIDCLIELYDIFVIEGGAMDRNPVERHGSTNTLE